MSDPTTGEALERALLDGIAALASSRPEESEPEGGGQNVTAQRAMFQAA